MMSRVINNFFMFVASAELGFMLGVIILILGGYVK